MKKILLLTALGVLAWTGTALDKEEQVSDVYLCNSLGGKKFHYSKNCRGLSRCEQEIIKVSLKKAKDLGKTLCGWE